MPTLGCPCTGPESQHGGGANLRFELPTAIVGADALGHQDCAPLIPGRNGLLKKSAAPAECSQQRAADQVRQG